MAAEEEEDYESLPSSSPVTHHMLAGSMAGVAEHCIMYPVDLVKTRMMCIRANPETNYASITGALREIATKEGGLRPLRGVQSVVAGAAPAHALYFACYERLKVDLTVKFTARGRPGESAAANAVAGAVATLFHDAVMNPAEVVKQRMQMFQSPYKNCRDCFKEVLRTEGVYAFYRSYATALTMNIPFQVTHFVLYEQMQEWTNPEREYNPLTHMISGGVAGGAAAAATTPLDVCRTLLNTQQGGCTVAHCPENPRGPGFTLNGVRPPRISGMFHALQIVYLTNGFPGFFKGCWPRVVQQTPATAISWSFYELFKFFLRNRSGDDDERGSGISGLTLSHVSGVAAASLPPSTVSASSSSSHSASTASTTTTTTTTETMTLESLVEAARTSSTNVLPDTPGIRGGVCAANAQPHDAAPSMTPGDETPLFNAAPATPDAASAASTDCGAEKEPVGR